MTPDHRAKISRAHVKMNKDRTAGLLLRLLSKSKSGDLGKRIGREVEQAARDFERDGEIQNSDRRQLMAVLSRYL